MVFTQLGLKAELTNVVATLGYTAPTPIQTQAIPVILEGTDVLACAQTGTGKTAAFTLPILQLLSQTSLVRRRAAGQSPRALVLAPTRELAAQVEKSVITYGKSLSLRAMAIFGGVNINPQIKQLQRGVDIIVATPGRLLDHVSQHTIDLSQIEILVLDEADRMLDMGFIHDIRRIIKLLPHKRQNLLFSATFPDGVKSLAESMLHNPECIEVAQRNTAVDTVEQVVHPVEKSNKRRLLSHLIHEGDLDRVLVFIKTKHAANRLAQQLQQDGITATAIHGNKSQGARTRALADFKSGAVSVLVATDIASRGLDIKNIPQVFNFDLPNVPEDYVHRIGRTGRAGETGMAVSLVSSDERNLLKDIQKFLHQDIKVETVSGFGEGALSAAALSTTKSTDEPFMRVKHGYGLGRQHRPASRRRARA